MVDWKSYRITGVRRDTGWSVKWIEFSLDDYVSYEGGSNCQFVYCKNCSPFDSWREGDYIEIDNDVTYYRNSIHDFASTSGIRFSSRDYKDLKEDYSSLKTQLNEQKRINSGLVSMLNNFSQKMLNNSEIFTSNQYFTEYDLSNCRQKLDKIFAENGKKSENQLALINRNSTDLLVTQETLRAAQVANLVLKQQVEEKNRLINVGTGTLQTTQDQLTTAQNQNQQKDTQITQLNNDLTTTRSQIGQLNTQITVKDNQITQVTNERNIANEQLALTRGQLEELRVLFNNLEIANNNKDQAIRQKEESLRAKEKEIIELRTQLGLLSPEEILNKKIASGEEELDDLVCTLSLPRQTIKNLRFAYKNLEFNTKVQYNQENIANIANNIEEIKEELLTFFVENNKERKELYKIYRSCEQIAKWKIELEQLYQQQYQAKQEQPTNQ